MAEEPRVDVRQARSDDRDAVVAFTSETWPRLGGDYLPRVFEEWVESDGPEQRTLVAVGDDGGDPVGICQGVLVFSWNTAGLGLSRAVGFEPVCEFRWIEPDPDPDAEAEGPSGFDVLSEPSAAWSAFRGSDADRRLAGVGLALEVSWARAELPRERFARADATFVVADAERARGTTYRTRTFERESDDGESERWAEYGVGSWDDHESFRSLIAAVARDAAELGVDRTRMLLPETPRHVSDAAYARVELSEDSDFVFERDLTRY
jgi:hypothetical protein